MNMNMNMRGIMDFSRETRFQERLLQKIKAECFGALSDEDLDYVNAAGTPVPPENAVIGMILPYFQENGEEKP